MRNTRNAIFGVLDGAAGSKHGKRLTSLPDLA